MTQNKPQLRLIRGGLDPSNSNDKPESGSDSEAPSPQPSSNGREENDPYYGIPEFKPGTPPPVGMGSPLDDEPYIPGYERSYILAVRKEIARIPSMSDEECYRFLIENEGPDYVEAYPKDNTYFIVDRLSVKNKAILSHVRDYLRIVFETRIKAIKRNSFVESVEAKTK